MAFLHSLKGQNKKTDAYCLRSLRIFNDFVQLEMVFSQLTTIVACRNRERFRAACGMDTFAQRFRDRRKVRSIDHNFVDTVRVGVNF